MEPQSQEITLFLENVINWSNSVSWSNGVSASKARS